MVDILKDKIPQHIAIIMDGNGRWAKARGLPRTQGHMEGVKRVDEIVKEASDLGVKVLTLFTFSTENWTRPENEVSMLMQTLVAVLGQKLKKLHDNNVRFRISGRRAGAPRQVLETFEKATAYTKDNTGLTLNLAFNYGGRQEIIDAVQMITRDCQEGRLLPEDISEESFSSYLYTSGLPDPDLLIRTSGELRISNFLLWQLSYAELYFTDKFWPDFTPEEFRLAIVDFQGRERRFGDILARKGEGA
jgi:undecaprenyl diphosphate synthase